MTEETEVCPHLSMDGFASPDIDLWRCQMCGELVINQRIPGTTFVSDALAAVVPKADVLTAEDRAAIGRVLADRGLLAAALVESRVIDAVNVRSGDADVGAIVTLERQRLAKHLTASDADLTVMARLSGGEG